MTGPGELFQRLVDAVTGKTRFDPLWPYQVVEEVSGRPSLKALGESAPFPDLPHVDAGHGLPGASSTLAVGTVVMVGFKGGNPGAPYVAGYLPGQPLPTVVVVNASSLIQLGGGTAVAAARSDKTDAALLALTTKLNLALTALGIPTLPTQPSTAAAKVFIE